MGIIGGVLQLYMEREREPGETGSSFLSCVSGFALATTKPYRFTYWLKLQYFGPLMPRTDSLEKALMLGKTEGRRRRGRQDEMVGWHHRPGGQGSLACCIPWGCKELDTERLN